MEFVATKGRKPLDRVSDYLLLRLLDWCDVVTLVRLSRSAKRLYLVAKDVMARSPGLVTDIVSFRYPAGLGKLVQRLQSPPTLMIIYNVRMPL